MLYADISEGQQASSLWGCFKVTSNHLALRFITSLLSIHMHMCRQLAKPAQKFTGQNHSPLFLMFIDSSFSVPYCSLSHWTFHLDCSASGPRITHRIQSDLSTATSALMKHFDCCFVLIQILSTYSLISSNINMEGYYSKLKLKRLELWNNIESYKRNVLLFQFRVGKWSQKLGFSVPHRWAS